MSINIDIARREIISVLNRWSDEFPEIKDDVFHYDKLLECFKIHGHITCYLVWDVDITNKQTSLRAITTTKERAEKYKKSIERQHEETETPQGFHIVCPTFDTRLILDIENVSYQRDGYIFIEEVKI